MIAGPPGIESTSEPGSGAGTCGDSCLGRSGAEVGERGGANVDLDVDFAVPRYRIEFGFRLADIGINLDLGLGVLSSLSILALALALVGVRIDINLGVPMGKLLLDDVSPPPGRLADIIGTE
jgi:hypothetical protein